MGENILREHPVLAFLAGGTVSGGTMEPDRTGGGFAGGQTAGQQGRRHTGQHIAAPAPGKTGIAPVGLTQTRPSGAATTVRAPFSTTTAFH